MKLFTPNIRKLERTNNIPELLKCLSSRNADVRYSAFVALAGRKDTGDEIIERLRDMINDSNPWVKTIAILKFAELGNASVPDNLMDIIIEGSRNAKLELLKIIAGRGATDDQSIMKVIMNALVDKQEIVRRQAIITAGVTKNRHLMTYLAERLHEKHYDLRIQAARALYDIGEKESADYLIGLLADKDKTVQNEARSLLATIDYEYVQKALHDAHFIQFIKGMNDKEPVRRETAKKIGSTVMREGLPLLHLACKDKYKGVRIEALKAIGVFKNPSSIEFIAPLLNDKYHDVRLEAINTLEQIMDIKSLDLLEEAFNDQSKQVREAANSAHHRMKRLIIENNQDCDYEVEFEKRISDV